MIETRHTFCRVCEPKCGLLATVEEGRLVKVEPDRDHPGSQGFACQRGLATFDIHHDPDRLDHPQVRAADGTLQRATWEEALDGIAGELRRILDAHGPDAIAVYSGNPAAFNSATGYRMPLPFAELGIKRGFNSGSQDCANKFAGSAAVFGTPMLHPVPDVDRADVILLIGSNWRSSKASFISLPNPYGALVAARRRGAQIWFVNPRRTESSTDLTGPTIQIKPDTDVYFLAAMLCEIERTVGFHPDAEDHGTHVEELRAFVRGFPPERVADVCGVAVEEIRTVAHAFATAPAATVQMSTGVNMGTQGTVAYWLIHMLALVTGNLDRPGGNVVGESFHPVPKGSHHLVETEFGTMWSAQLPGGLLPDFITAATDPVRALVVIGGNPLLSIPGEVALRAAFEQLELLVCVDIYPSATTELAHWLLPATDMYEREDCHVASGHQARAWVQWTDAVVEPAFERWHEWRIFGELARRLGATSVLDEPDVDAAVWGRHDAALARAGTSREELRAQPGGTRLVAEVAPTGRFFDELVATADGRVDCCPPSLVSGLAATEKRLAELASEPDGTLKLISGRHSRMQNSWFANVPGMKRGARDTNRLAMFPDDAAGLGLAAGDVARVSSAWGEVSVEVALDDTLRPGVVWLEHGWGLQRGLALSRERSGVNVNILFPHGEGSFEPLSSQQQLTGVAVRVVPEPGGSLEVGTGRA